MTSTETQTPVTQLESPGTLVSIVWAARLAGDKELERAGKRRQDMIHGIKLSFRRRQPKEEDAR